MIRVDGYEFFDGASTLEVSRVDDQIRVRIIDMERGVMRQIMLRPSDAEKLAEAILELVKKIAEG